MYKKTKITYAYLQCVLMTLVVVVVVAREPTVTSWTLWKMNSWRWLRAKVTDGCGWVPSLFIRYSVWTGQICSVWYSSFSLT